MTAHSMALAAHRVRADVIDGSAFPELAVRFRVHGVPTVIVDDELVAEGPIPDETLLELVLHAADPFHPAPRITSVPFRACGRLERRADE